MKNYNYYILLLTTLIIAACGNSTDNIKDSINELSAKKICCSSFKEMSYEQLSYNTGKSITINNNSPAYNFQSGKSYFKAFKLPKFTDTYQVRIKSSSFMSSTLFYPMFLFLDEYYKPTHMELPIQRAQRLFIASSGLDAYIDVTDEESKDKYMIVYTSNKVLGKGHDYNRMPVYGAVPISGGGIIPINYEGGRHNVPYNIQGNVKIELEK